MFATTTSLLTAVTLTFGFGGVQGNGTIKQETRPVEAFHAVAVGSGVQAKVTLGEKAALVVEGDENLLPLLETVVKDGVLTVRVPGPRGVRPTKPLRATITTPRLDAVDASGGAQVEAPASATPRFLASASGGAQISLSALASDEVAVDASGGAKVQLSGTAAHLVVSASGGAKVLAWGVPARSGKVDASGGARVELSVSGELQGEASGGSRIHLKGHPQIQKVSRSGGARVVAE